MRQNQFEMLWFSAPLAKLHLRSIQIYEFIRSSGWHAFLKEVVHFNRKAIVVEKDLAEAEFRQDIFRKENVEFVELHPGTILERKLSYALTHRYLKAMYYFGKGYGCHALLRGDEVIGDIWYYAPRESNRSLYQWDLHWLGVTLDLDSVYSFDIFFMPKERGKNLSAALQSSSMYALHKKGYAKAYAYYWSDNTPAVWNTRVINRWKETKSLSAKRFFLFRRVVEIDDGNVCQYKIPIKRVGYESKRDPHGVR